MIIDKLTLAGEHLRCDDLTPNQKLVLWDVMKEHGASQGFAYDRFFKEGFRQWEIIGIDKIKLTFLEEHQEELWTGDVEPEAGTPGDRGYAAILATYGDILQQPGGFYRVIGMVVGLKKQLYEQMSQMGMCQNAVLNHFSADDWKDYERIGINTIVEEFEKRISE